jgi:hypothetical protein
MQRTRSRSLLSLLPWCWLALWGALVLASLSGATLFPVQARGPVYTRLLVCTAPAAAVGGPRASTLPCPVPPPLPGLFTGRVFECAFAYE